MGNLDSLSEQTVEVRLRHVYWPVRLGFYLLAGQHSQPWSLLPDLRADFQLRRGVARMATSQEHVPESIGGPTLRQRFHVGRLCALTHLG